MSTCLNLPSLSCSLSSEDIPHTLTLALLQVTLTSYRTLSSYPLLLNLPLLFSPSVSPLLTKGICHSLRGSFSPSPFIPFPLSPLHLSIKATKGGRCSVRKAFRFLSHSSSVAAPFLSTHISPLCVFCSLSSSLCLNPFLSSHLCLPIKHTIGRSSIQNC